MDKTATKILFSFDKFVNSEEVIQAGVAVARKSMASLEYIMTDESGSIGSGSGDDGAGGGVTGLQVGMVFVNSRLASRENFRITAVNSTTSITVTRSFGRVAAAGPADGGAELRH